MTATTVRPGALTALLAELARAPEAAGWELPAVPGEKIGRFEIVRELGRGGFGVVYEARDVELGRSVAFKAVRAGSSDAVREQRTLAEAEAAARLAHPNIVHLYDVGRCERGPYLIMELLRGEALDERLARGPVALREAVRIAVEIARGVAHAHGQGVVHRDLKPANVFVCEDGQVKVLDFGLAHVFGRGGPMGGTPAYMAPEQAAGEPGDERADVYSLGVVVRELVPSDAPPPLARLLERLAERDPAGRPASAADVLAQLAAIQRALEPKRVLWAAVAAAVVAVAGAGLFAWLSQRPLPPGPLLTAIADTQNQTGDPDLDGISDLLRAGLGQSSRFSVMPRSRLVNLARDAAGTRPAALDARALREAAVRAKADLLVVPSARRSGSVLELSVEAVDLGRGTAIAGASEVAAGNATVPAALDRLARRMRRALREEPGQAPRPEVEVDRFAPAAPTALRHFSDGKRLDSEARFDEAFQAYARAAEADPRFLLPRIELLRYADWGIAGVHRDVALIDADRKVLRDGLERLPRNERAYAETLARPWDEGRNMTEYVASLDRAIEAWPEDPRPHVDAANLLLSQRADLDAARPYAEKAVALAPLTEGAAIDFLLALGRLDEALARARRWTEDSPSWLSFNNLRLVYQWRGEVPDALDAARRMVERAPEKVAWFTFLEGGAFDEAEAAHRRGDRPDFRWLAVRGRLREALAVRDVVRPAGLAGGEGIDNTFFRSFLLLPMEDPAATWRETEKLFEVGYGFFQCHALQLALVGDRERAWRLSISKAPDGHVCHRLHMAVRAWKAGDRDRALSDLSRIWAPSSHLYRGEILAELGRHQDAIEAYRTYRRQRGPSVWDGNFDVWNYPRSLYLEAVSLDASGDRDGARATLRLLRRLWEGADRDLPLVRRASALEGRLAAGVAR